MLSINCRGCFPGSFLFGSLDLILSTVYIHLVNSCSYVILWDQTIEYNNILSIPLFIIFFSSYITKIVFLYIKDKIFTNVLISFLSTCISVWTSVYGQKKHCNESNQKITSHIYLLITRYIIPLCYQYNKFNAITLM